MQNLPNAIGVMFFLTNITARVVIVPFALQISELENEDGTTLVFLCCQILQ